jgi:hypothetical protein
MRGQILAPHCMYTPVGHWVKGTVVGLFAVESDMGTVAANGGESAHGAMRGGAA